MRNHIPAPDPALAAILLGSPMRRLVQGKAEEKREVYRGLAHKRTGRTAREARVETFIGGRNKDRQCARLIVGQPTSLKAAMDDLRRTLQAGGTRR